MVKTWSTPVQKEKMHQVPCTLCNGNRFKRSITCEGFSYVKCTLCGLVQINPQPLPLEVKKRYIGWSGNNYCNYGLENENKYLGLQKLALKDAGFEKIEKKLMEVGNPKVLDVGCATGALLYFLKNRGWDTTGIEISPAAEYARQNYGLSVYNCNLEDVNFPSNSFDIVLASHLIEHLNNPGEFIREAWRILRPGGFLFLTTPNISGFQSKLFGERWRSAIFDHLYLFSVRTINKLLKNHNFIIVKSVTWGGLAEGTAPHFLKKIADYAVKILGLGDVMIVKARKKPD